MHAVTPFGSRVRRYLVPVSFLLLVHSMAHAQWTVINLHPAGATGESQGRDVRDGRQVGYARISGGIAHASLWSGAAASWIDLNPVAAGFTGSQAYAMDGDHQVGYTDIGGRHHASLWSGTAHSWIDLHPPGATDSLAMGVARGQQVGEANPGGGAGHASLWRGSAASWVDLHPAGATWSNAQGTDGTYQVGFAVLGGIRNASIWSGDAASWRSLHPAGATESWAMRVQGGQQVGYAIVGGIRRASLWSGSAASWVDLNPGGSTESWAWALSHDRQVGYVRIAGAMRASLWTGSAASWVDLHASLPLSFSASVAHGVWTDLTHTYVAGYGFNTANGRNESMLWIGPPPCNPDFNQDGVADQDDVVYLIDVIGGGENFGGLDPDFNLDGVTDQDDVGMLISVIAGQACP